MGCSSGVSATYRRERGRQSDLLPRPPSSRTGGPVWERRSCRIGRNSPWRSAKNRSSPIADLRQKYSTFRGPLRGAMQGGPAIGHRAEHSPAPRARGAVEERPVPLASIVGLQAEQVRAGSRGRAVQPPSQPTVRRRACHGSTRVVTTDAPAGAVCRYRGCETRWRRRERSGRSGFCGITDAAAALLLRADQLLYRSRHGGRDRVTTDSV